MADRFGSDVVERALAMQEGSVLANEVLRLRAVLERVRELHRPNAHGNICETCLTEEPFLGDDWGNADWPCATARALGET